ncbi:ATP-binding protein [Deinococcus yavapaiensis]|nr:GAF domain-containing protein [Deinococcus yavapaiensis]
MPDGPTSHGHPTDFIAALDVFTAFTDLAATETDVRVLTSKAYEVMTVHFLAHSSAYYEVHDGLWKALTWTPEMTPEQIHMIRSGLPLDVPSFAEALTTKQPVYIDGWNSRRDGIENTDVFGPVCIYPLTVDGDVRGLFTVGLRVGRQWQPRDRALMRALGRSLNMVLERTEQARQLHEERAALEAFAVYTEHVGHETDVPTLVHEAIRVLRNHLNHVSVVYYELHASLWKAEAWSEDLTPTVIEQVTRGIPVHAPDGINVPQSGTAVFLNDWNADAHSLPAATAYRAAASVPLFNSDGTPRLLAVAAKDTHVWSEREKAMIRAVGRALSLAVERAATSRQLKVQNLDLDARTRALEGFAALTRDLGVRADVYELIRRAQDVVLSLLPPGYALYYERDGKHWRNRVQAGDVRNAYLQAFIDAGPLIGETPSVDVPWTTHHALFQDQYARGSDTPVEMVGHVNAAASLPVFRDGEPVGVFIAVLFEQRAWSSADRVVLETVVRNLGIAIERAEQTRQVEQQRAEVEARNRVLSTFEEWTRDLAVGGDVSEVIRRAQRLLYELLPIQAAVYYERDGNKWRVRSLLGEYGSDGLRRAHEAGLPYESTGNLRVPFETGEVYYQDPYDPHIDGLAEHMTHVQATAILPLKTAGGVQSLLGLARFTSERWTTTERTVLETVGHSLALALDRVEKTTALERERAALAAANEELDAFAYSVSHDLRTPVRHILSFNNLLRKTLASSLDAKTERYFTLVDEAGQSMNRLIDAMLNMSRTSRLPLRLGPVDLGVLMRQIERASEAECLGRNVRWDIAPLPLVTGDQDLLRQVLENLVSNALKYTRTRDVTVIRVWAAEREAHTAVFVEDNGVGFDSKYASKLFGVFQRLHRADEFEGTGVGLANVRRIVRRHGGEVFARSRPGEGATFGFTLPNVTGGGAMSGSSVP